MEPEPRLKTAIWVQAQVRLCDRHFIPIAVAKRGDADAGAVLLRLLRSNGKSLILRRQFGLGGTSQWAAAGGGELDPEAADDLLARERKRDPDLWIVEVDDPKGRYWPDRPFED